MSVLFSKFGFSRGATTPTSHQPAIPALDGTPPTPTTAPRLPASDSAAMTSLVTPNGTPNSGLAGFSSTNPNSEKRPVPDLPELTKLNPEHGDIYDRVRLSRNVQRARDAIGKSALLKVQWEPDYIIQLLHESVGVRTNASEGLTIDGVYPAPPALLARGELPSIERLIYCGILDGSSNHTSYYNRKKNRQIWAPVSGLAVYLKASTAEPEKIYIVSSKGQNVSLSSVMWASGVEILPQRKVHHQKLYKKLAAEYDRAEAAYKEDCKAYRINRRKWQADVVEHEFFDRNNRGIFRPGTTPLMIRAALKKAKADNHREAQNAFQPDYIGCAPRTVAENTGKKLDASEDPKQIRLQSQLAMDPVPAPENTTHLAALLDVPDPFTPEQREANQLLLEEFLSTKLGKYTAEYILQEGSSFDSSLADATDIELALNACSAHISQAELKVLRRIHDEVTGGGIMSKEEANAALKEIEGERIEKAKAVQKAARDARKARSNKKSKKRRGVVTPAQDPRAQSTMNLTHLNPKNLKIRGVGLLAGQTG